MDKLVHLPSIQSLINGFTAGITGLKRAVTCRAIQEWKYRFGFLILFWIVFYILTKLLLILFSTLYIVFWLFVPWDTVQLQQDLDWISVRLHSSMVLVIDSLPNFFLISMRYIK
jgi:hypothetical protein